MIFQQFAQLRLVRLAAVPYGFIYLRFLLFVAEHRLHAHHGSVAAAGELAVFVIHVGDAAAHSGGKVAPGFAQHQHSATGHVFAAMVAGTFDHCRSARQAHRKALTGHPAEKRFAAGGAIHHGIAHNGVADGFAPKINTGPNYYAPAGQALAGVVVGVANQVQGHAIA